MDRCHHAFFPPLGQDPDAVALPARVQRRGAARRAPVAGVAQHGGAAHAPAAAHPQQHQQVLQLAPSGHLRLLYSCHGAEEPVYGTSSRYSRVAGGGGGGGSGRREGGRDVTACVCVCVVIAFL